MMGIPECTLSWYRAPPQRETITQSTTNECHLKLVRVDLLLLRLQLKTPFETSQGRFAEKETVIVRAQSDSGLRGYGEAPAFQTPAYTYECSDTVLPILERHILPRVIGVELDSAISLEKCYRGITGHHMAKAGVEGAYWHLLALEKGVPLYRLWGGVRNKVEVGLSIGSEPNSAAILERIGSGLDRGYRRIKIKIKRGMDTDLLHEARREYPAANLAADGNGAYSLSDLALFQGLDHLKLSMLEQPLAHEDLLDHAVLQEQITTSICLDESIDTPSTARRAIDIGAARIINVKPGRLGGYGRAMATAKECAKRSIPAWCGGMLETGIGKALNVHLSSLAPFTLPSETSGTDRYFAEDVLFDPIIVDADGCISLPESPGLGYEVDEEALAHLTVVNRTVSG